MDEFLGIFKALSDETRYNLVSLLLTHDYCVSALAKRLEISEAAVSQHLQVLRKVGMVTGEKRGYYTHYWIDREVLQKTAEKLLELASRIPECKGSCRKQMKGDYDFHRKEEESDV